ncbi:MAG: hypothetical protein AAFS10_07340, partial [Myxococcota bacterium]
MTMRLPNAGWGWFSAVRGKRSGLRVCTVKHMLPLGVWAVALVFYGGGCQANGCSGGPHGEDDAEVGEPAAPTAIHEVEPNATAKQATPYVQRSKAPGSPLVLPFEGVLTNGSDVDWVAIPAALAKSSARSAQARTLRLEPLGDGDVALGWDTSVAVTDREGMGQDEVVSQLTTEAVVVAVRLGAAHTGAFPLRYRLTLEPQQSAPPPGVHIEAGPNATQEPTLVTAPGEAQGVMQFRGDEDRFAIDIASMRDQGGARLELIDAAGAELEAELTWGSTVVGTLRTSSTKTRPSSAEDKRPKGGLVEEGKANNNGPGVGHNGVEEAKGNTAVFPNLAIPSEAKVLGVRIRALGDAPGWRGGYTLRVLPLPSPPKGTIYEWEGGAEEALQRLREPGVVVGFLPPGDALDAFNLTIPDVDEG